MSSIPPESRISLGRRAFLQHGALLLTGISAAPLGQLAAAAAAEAKQRGAVRIGLVTDLHYASSMVI